MMQKQIVLTGKQLVILETALNELRNRNIRSEGYLVSLYWQEEIYIVIFKDPSDAPNLRGSGNNMPSFEVELDEDGKVLRAKFSR